MPTWTVKASLFGIFAIYCIIMIASWGSIGVDPETGEETGDGTMTKLMLVLGGAIYFGFLTLVYIIPMIGDLSATFFYSSGELIENDENMRGAVLLAQGNYEGAIAEYQKQADKDPEARFPIAEIAKIHLEKLNDPQTALAVLQGALDREWKQDDAAFLLFRIAEIQSDHLADFDGARATLETVTEQIPDSRHSANATHKLKELDEKELIAQQRIARGESPIPVKEESDIDPKEAARLQREKEEQEFLAKMQAAQGGGGQKDPGEEGGA